MKLKIHKSIDPKWNKWSVSMPGISDTQWFDSEKEAKNFIVNHGHQVFNPDIDGDVRISKSEHAALVAVAEAAKALLVQTSIACNYCLAERGFQDLHTAASKAQESLIALAAVRNQQQSPTAS